MAQDLGYRLPVRDAFFPSQSGNFDASAGQELLDFLLAVGTGLFLVLNQVNAHGFLVLFFIWVAWQKWPLSLSLEYNKKERPSESGLQ